MKLLPCPFCGVDAHLISAEDSEVHQVCCLDCTILPRTMFSSNKEGVIAQWNTRAKVSEWQPIETAPKDGSHIILYGTYQWQDYKERQKEGIVVGYFLVDSYYLLFPDEETASEYCHWVLVNANPYTDRIAPTHWMPIPKPPKNADTMGQYL